MDSESSDNPALVAANQEHARMLSDPTHPHYAGLRRNDQASIAYADGLFRKALESPTGTAPIQEPALQGMHLSAEDRVAQSETDAMLRQTLGESYDTDMRDMRIGAQHLFATPESQRVLEALSILITDLGPLAQVRGIRFLAELGQLVTNNQQKGRRT